MAKSSKARLKAQAKYNRKPAQKKRRASLNKENRKRGTYGNGDGKDVSHTKSGKTILEKASTNRRRNGRSGKSKLK
tara:strand:- start:1369 stop:1596 length:228 start_codon:yes stop_codon:yes gene_type:complete